MDKKTGSVALAADPVLRSERIDEFADRQRLALVGGDAFACLHDLRREYESVPKDASVPLYEDTGNGIVRVNLAAVKEEQPEVLKQLTEQGVFAFGNSELDVCFAEYEKAGYPMVSHSVAYRESYMSAYRVIRKAYLPMCQGL